MAYEIDYIGVKADKATKDADAICLRWKTGIALNGMPIYKVGVIDGGFEAHGNAMIAHMNQYYFDDAEGVKSKEKKTIDFGGCYTPRSRSCYRTKASSEGI